MIKKILISSWCLIPKQFYFINHNRFYWNYNITLNYCTKYKNVFHKIVRLIQHWHVMYILQLSIRNNSTYYCMFIQRKKIIIITLIVYAGCLITSINHTILSVDIFNNCHLHEWTRRVKFVFNWSFKINEHCIPEVLEHGSSTKIVYGLCF